ncbi:MAG: glutaredoxin family protein [Patescibacteria group bacterium]
MTVTVYSTPSCPYCKLVKEFLKEKSIDFTDVNVASDANAASEMVKLSGQMGVPVIVVGTQVIVGWNKDALEETLKSSAGLKDAKAKKVKEAA